MTKINGTNIGVIAWDDINWHQCERQVMRLQRRIFKNIQNGNTNIKTAFYLAEVLARSFSAKVIAIKTVTQTSTGRFTAGIDGKVALTNEERWKYTLLNYNEDNYRPMPVKRVSIPKDNGKMRTLGIPTIKDRIAQTLLKMAMEPIYEAIFEENSYGFRPGRSCHDAIENIRQSINRIRYRGRPPFILELDIKGFFDNITHEAILSRIPKQFRSKVRKFLKVGVVSQGKFLKSPTGTPQGGPLSPLLANIVLNGLQEFIRRVIIRGGVNFSIPNSSDYSYTRYADDLVVVGSNPRVLEQFILPRIQFFLHKRGLEVNKVKTRTTSIIEGFNFLGFNIRLFRRYGDSLFIQPQKEKAKAFYQSLKVLIDNNKQVSQENLIKMLNPKLRGLATYYRYWNKGPTFRRLDHLIFQKLWKWSYRRHPKKSLSWIQEKYYYYVNEDDKRWRFGQELKRTRFILEGYPKLYYKKAKGSFYDPRLQDYWEKRDPTIVAITQRNANSHIS